MRDYDNIITKIGNRIADKYGKLNLFGLFERDDLKNKWDVLISVQIPLKNKSKLIEELIKEFKDNLPHRCILQISRFIFLKSDNKFVLNINSQVKLEESVVELNNCQNNNVNIQHAIIYESNNYKTILKPPQKNFLQKN
jgi:hypothetical protein